MKKIILIITVMLLSFSLGACSSKKTNGITFTKVNVSEKTPKEEYDQQYLSSSFNKPVNNLLLSNENINNEVNYKVIPLSTTEVSPTEKVENGIEEISVLYNGNFTLIINLNNPNKYSIHEVKLKNLKTGNVDTYQPGQKEDYNGDGQLEDIFYVNQAIDKIFLGVKLSDNDLPGEQIQYAVKDITYYDDGVIGYTRFPDDTQNLVSVNVEEEIKIDDIIYFYSTEGFVSESNNPTKDEVINSIFGGTIYNKFATSFSEMSIFVAFYKNGATNTYPDKTIYIIDFNTDAFNSTVPVIKDDSEYTNIYFKLSDNQDIVNHINDLSAGNYEIRVSIASLKTTEGKVIEGNIDMFIKLHCTID